MAMPVDVQNPARGQGNLGAELEAKRQNVNAVATPTPAPPLKAPTASVPVDRVNPRARYGSRPGEKRIDVGSMTKPLGSFEKGTDSVPKTGVYKLHEGEAVIPKEENMKDMKDKMVSSLSDGEKKPKKEIKEMVHRKSKNGKHIVVHKHHHPEHHPDEEHVMNDMAELHQHMDNHAGEPNEGEPPAAEGAEAPAPMTAAPSPMPAPQPMQGQ